MEMRAYHFSTLEAKAGGQLRVWGQPGVHSKFRTNLDCQPEVPQSTSSHPFTEYLDLVLRPGILTSGSPSPPVYLILHRFCWQDTTLGMYFGGGHALMVTGNSAWRSWETFLMTLERRKCPVVLAGFYPENPPLVLQKLGQGLVCCLELPRTASELTYLFEVTSGHLQPEINGVPNPNAAMMVITPRFSS